MYFRNSDQKSVDAFLQQLTSIVVDNMSDEHFGVERLAREAGLSRSALHRRLTAVARKSATRFIREIRLDKAMDMMQNTNDTAAEVAFKTGFGSPAYFHHCFHMYFGCTPLAARKAALTGTSDCSGMKPGIRHYLRKIFAGWFACSGFICPFSGRYRIVLVFILILFILIFLYFL